MSNPQSTIEVALVIRDDLQRYGIDGMLRSVAAVTAVYCYTTPEQAARAACEHRPDLLVVSAAELAGTAARHTLANLRRQGVLLLIIVDRDTPLDNTWAELVDGLLDRTDLQPRMLQEAVADVVSGRFHVPAGLVSRLFSSQDRTEEAPARSNVITLTPREFEVLKLLANGLSNKQAARSLCISENGVKRLVGNVLAKFNSPNRTLAVVRAIEIGLLNR